MIPNGGIPLHEQIHRNDRFKSVAIGIIFNLKTVVFQSTAKELRV